MREWTTVSNADNTSSKIKFGITQNTSHGVTVRMISNFTGAMRLVWVK